MNFNYAKGSQLALIDLNQIFSYRYAVFVERLHLSAAVVN